MQTLTGRDVLMDALARAATGGARFVSFIYRNAKGELAKHTVIIQASFTNVYRDDLTTLEAKIASITAALADNPGDAVLTLQLQAAQEIHSSLCVSLSGGLGNNPAFTHSADARGAGNETYDAIDGLPGVKIHRETGEVHIHGLAHAKEVIEPGIYKPVKSRPLTLAKNAIDDELRRSKIRQFNVGRLLAARMFGETIELDCMRD
jgi:hypothetical protein